MNTPNHTAQAPLHIALVTETYLPEVNGVAITIGRMVEGLIKRRHRIHLIRPRQHKQDAPQRTGLFEETLVAGMQLPGYPELKAGLPARNKLLRLWRQQRPDIVHIATEGPLGWSACSAARKLGIPVSTDFHTNFHNYSQHYGVGWLNKPIASYLRHFHNRTDCTLVPTAALRQELLLTGYKDVMVVSRGVDTELFHPAKRSAELRNAWGVADDTPVAVLVSRLAAEKNLPVAIQAFERMRAIRPDARLVMVGDGPVRAALEKQHPHVIFAGMRTGEDLAAHYASGDIFLYPSLTETYGNVTVEAMASGLATVAYDYAAARQHIRHEVNGLLAPFDDTAAFIAQAGGLVADMERIHRIRNGARQTVESLTWDHIMGQMETVLTDLVREQGGKNVQTEPSAATD
ncbi:MAG: glycosyltransferase family 1 protein [Gallionella sp.]|jgi:glycosyltransferase involved in cell wall biosynthesis|nr:glycosyltransferase family 1 protein [Gallionella sp.]MCK9352906.1 glycosyltransferase family 1 protein [Gallionella sp.]